MHSVQAQISAREVAIGRLNDVTTWIAVAAVAALGVFGVIAAQTIPGHASADGSSSTSTDSAGPPASTSTSSSFGQHHDRDSPTVSGSSGPPLVVTGGSH